jgi:hypothetical protein
MRGIHKIRNEYFDPEPAFDMSERNIRMKSDSMQKKAIALIICMFFMIIAAPLLQAETNAGLPVVGKVTALRSVSINGSPQPTGRVILSGDLISAEISPAQVALKNGGNVVMTKGSAATFSKSGNELSMHVEKGTVAFRFAPAEKVRIETASHRFIAAKVNSINAGEIEVGADAQAKLSLNTGGFSAYEKSNGMLYQITPSSTTQLPQETSGKGTLTNGRNTLTDDRQNWTQSLANKCVRVGTEQHRIISNTPTRLTLDGAWTLNNGIYDYVVTECVAAKTKSSTSAPPAAQKGMSSGTKAAIGILAGGGAAAGIAVYMATKSGG